MAAIIGLCGIVAFLLYAAQGLHVPMSWSFSSSVLGAVIGIKHSNDKHNRLLRALIGIAMGVFISIGLAMSMFGYLVH